MAAVERPVWDPKADLWFSDHEGPGWVDFRPPFLVELQEPAEGIVVGNVLRPSVGRRDGMVEFGVRGTQPMRRVIVQARQSPLGEILLLLCVALSIMQGMVEVSETAFITMKGIGATALIFLALRMLSTRRKDTEGRSTSDGDQLRDASAGLAVGLSSPINLVFLLALLPQLVPGHGLDVAGTAGIIAAVLGGAAVSQLGAALIGAASGRIVRGAARHIECLGAVSMIGFAAVAMGAPIA